MIVGRSQARAALQAVAAGNFMIQLAIMPVSTLLPTLGQIFGVDAATSAWVMNAYLLTLTGLVLTTGRLGDLYGHRRVFSVGIAVFTLGAIVAGLAPSLIVMIVGRSAQGIGGALMMGNALAILMRLVPSHEHGRAIGLAAVAASLGALVGVLMGSFLLSIVSWRWIFLIVVPAGVLAYWQARRLPADEPRGGHVARPDLLGATLLFLMLTTLSLSFTHLHGGEASFEAGWPYHTGMQVLTAVLLAAFIVVETRAKEPMIPLRLLRHRRFTMAILANCALHMTMMGSIFLVPFLVEQGLGRPPSTTGLLLAPMQVAGMAASYAGGWLYDRTRSRLLAPLSLVVIGGGFAALGLLGTSLTDLSLLSILVVVGLATNIFQTANNTSAMAALPVALGGFASGMLETSRQLGHTVAVALAAGVLGLAAEGALATQAGRDSSVQGIFLAILSFSLVAFVGLGFALFATETRSSATTAQRNTAPVSPGADD